jgi:DNA polymerase-4
LLAVSEEASVTGVVPGQSLGTALRLCPDAYVLPPDPPVYEAVAQEIVRDLSSFSPKVEYASDGRFFVDATGTAGPGHGLGRVIDLGMQARHSITSRLGLAGTVGVAINKLVSGIAAEEALPRDPLRDVPPGCEARFLAPLPAPRLPGVGACTEARLLRDLNVRLVGQLAAIELAVLYRTFGRSAYLLHDRARGIDYAPVCPRTEETQIAETAHLPVDSNDAALLTRTAFRLAANAGWRLRRDGLVTRRVVLTVTHTDGVRTTQAATFRPPVADERRLEAGIAQLLESVLDRRVRVRTIALVCRDLASTPQQLDLFAGGASGDARSGDDAQAQHIGDVGRAVAACARSSRAARLVAALDRVRERFGPDALRYGRAF